MNAISGFSWDIRSRLCFVVLSFLKEELEAKTEAIAVVAVGRDAAATVVENVEITTSKSIVPATTTNNTMGPASRSDRIRLRRDTV